METNFKYIASSRSTEELIERVDNRQKYMPETVEASVAELQHRKHEFSDEELKIISEDVQAHRSNASLVSSQVGLFNSDYKNVVVNDVDAPLFYSRRAVYAFSFLFGALFGSIMFAMNLSKLGKTKEILWVLLFGVGFTALQLMAISFANPGAHTGVQIIGGIIAAYCLDYFFWQRYIGYSIFYRARSVWAPIIIAAIFSVLIIAGTIYGTA